jgi:hypothetical protein
MVKYFMLNKNIAHAKMAETDREPPHGAKKKKIMSLITYLIISH